MAVRPFQSAAPGGEQGGGGPTAPPERREKQAFMTVMVICWEERWAIVISKGRPDGRWRAEGRDNSAYLYVM